MKHPPPASEGLARRPIWGKYISASRYLPLVSHCLDVALTFRALCDLPGIRRSLQRATADALTGEQCDRLAVLALLHDVGKANWGFQGQVYAAGAPKGGHIRELAPLLDPGAMDEALHMAFVGALPPEMPAWFPDDPVASSYFLATFSHHGRPLQFKGELAGNYWPARQKWWRPLNGVDPMVTVAGIGGVAREAFPQAFLPPRSPLPAEARFHHRYAGLLMLADWLGSHSHWFPVVPIGAAGRLQHSRTIAPAMLRAVGLDPAPLRPALTQRTFAERFAVPPRPLQSAIDGLDPGDNRNGLVIAESETGSGKTEAALDWFYRLFAAGLVDGLYFALPTRVAAREIYGRVRGYVERWYPDPSRRPVTVLAVPGYAQADGIPSQIVLPDEGMRWQDDAAQRRYERQWAAERPKRFLAATLAVGTVDQALLSVIQTAHAHLRSICLDRSLLVVDEVHASDEYMSQLLEVLLRQHLGAGGRALLLSATLGARARHRFAACAGAREDLPSAPDAVGVPYPALTVADGRPRALGAPTITVKSVRFDALPLVFSPEEVCGRLVDALGLGSRVLAVMNTVGRANAFLRALEAHPGVRPEWLFSCSGVVCPHHGRFAPADRSLLDQCVTERLGADTPPGPLLLVGTQTLEQSLDIDADLLLTDLAPMDILLQRAGRLHRHRRRRPTGWTSAAHCLVLVPSTDMAAGIDTRGRICPAYQSAGFGSVYEDLRALELTRRLLAPSLGARIPQDNRRLVEAVTHPDHLSSLSADPWPRHAQEIEGRDMAQAIAARHAAADFDALFGTFEFNELGGKVSTRLGAGNLQLPLDRPVSSPFGKTLSEILIPSHLAPSQPGETVTVESSDEGSLRLRCAERSYHYSRFGLEVAE